MLSLGGKILEHARKRVLAFDKARLAFDDFSIISNNCLGSFVSHDLGLRFNSPTINLTINIDSFILFCEHLEHYLSVEIEERCNIQSDFPVGILRGDYGVIQVNFVHYKSFAEAKECWERRTRRVNLQKVIILAMSQWADSETLERFDRLPYERKCCLCAGHKRAYFRSDLALPKSFFLYGYHEGKILEYGLLSTRRYYARFFDYVHFLNSGELHKKSLFSRFPYLF